MWLQVIGVEDMPLIRDGDDLAELVVRASEKQGTPLENGDVLVLCHVAVSKAEGRTIDLRKITPSEIASNFSLLVGKDPRLVEVILRESRAIRRMARARVPSQAAYPSRLYLDQPESRGGASACCVRTPLLGEAARILWVCRPSAGLLSSRQWGPLIDC